MIRRVGVVGCGLMGSGIAEVVARAGYDVVVRELSAELLERGLGRIDASMRRAVERGKLDEAARDAARARIRGTTALEDLAGVDLVIEAVIERMDEKKAVLGALDRIVAPGVVLASNTSSLSITEMAAATRRPDRVVGLHFFNPVPVMPLVEIVRGLATAEEVVAAMREFAGRLGKTVVVARDTPGFIVNRLLIPYLLDAIRVLELGVASREDIDTAITLGLGHPMGPLTLLDFVGLDTTYYIAEAMFQEFKDSRYAPPPLLKQMVLAGWWGRKSGRGFYEYG
ncbi:MAG: 3-hydroxybutyryl-CoA dehydrogenase [Armatimonadota bacterium]|nr:3-hydroxybutyryl-CoA dehydrogenase [Armatimonadota bacterium]MDR7454709.1 3-hydroxybutyryl-CoA dehydrogenase [Armatimonadota bacterium]MDR7456901.1 3-hydroxybutyryl-CoA dehydrogenase [Armatimonadota bacterium]MDR7496793.1 3-hydroxybutyryl-CoA dehydrogenase [Armatimonadota bacterium]